RQGRRVTLARKSAVAKGDKTRDKIKASARELFARYGIDAVTIRDIAAAAGQKNGAAVNYYFRSKDDLINEILDEAASAVDAHRKQLVDDLEKSGREITVREILRILVSRSGSEERDRTRLFTMLQLYRRDLMHT